MTAGLNNNSDANDTLSTTRPPQEDAMAQTWLLVLFIALYCIIFVLGVAGNSLVVYVVLHTGAMQTITNVFIANLAASDITMCLLAVPFTPLSGLLRTWVFGDVLCHVVPMALGVSVHVSTLTSTAIAVDRFFVIVHPFKPRLKMVHCVLLIVVIWIVSMCISLPLAVYQKVSWLEDGQIYVCHELWPRPSSRQFFTVTSLVLQYIVPCGIISFCYVRVSQSLRRRACVKLGTQSRTREQADIARKRRTNKMLIAMVSIFVGCWLPLNVIHLIAEFDEEIQSGQYFLLAFFVAHIVAMSSIVYNPFLYAWMNDNFKKEFRQVLPCLFSSSEADRPSDAAPAPSAITPNRQTTTDDAGNGNRIMTETPESYAQYYSSGGGGINNIGAAIYEADMNNVCLQLPVAPY